MNPVIYYHKNLIIYKQAGKNKQFYMTNKEKEFSKIDLRSLRF
jgi:hypothetical protein